MHEAKLYETIEFVLVMGIKNIFILNESILRFRLIMSSKQNKCNSELIRSVVLSDIFYKKNRGCNLTPHLL